MTFSQWKIAFSMQSRKFNILLNLLSMVVTRHPMLVTDARHCFITMVTKTLEVLYYFYSLRCVFANLRTPMSNVCFL